MAALIAFKQARPPIETNPLVGDDMLGYQGKTQSRAAKLGHSNYLDQTSKNAALENRSTENLFRNLIQFF
jgi:hypothetical protein